MPPQTVHKLVDIHVLLSHFTLQITPYNSLLLWFTISKSRHRCAFSCSIGVYFCSPNSMVRHSDEAGGPGSHVHFLWFMFGVHVWIVVLWLDSSVIGVILVWLILWMKNDWTNVAKKRIFLAILLGENKIPISAVLIEVLLAVWTWLDFQSLSCQVLSSFSK